MAGREHHQQRTTYYAELIEEASRAARRTRTTRTQMKNKKNKKKVRHVTQTIMANEVRVPAHYFDCNLFNRYVLRPKIVSPIL